MNQKRKEKDIWLETLLKTHRVEIRDNGFSASVLADIKAQEKRRLVVLAPFFVVGVSLLVLFFPYDIFSTLTGPLEADYVPLLPTLIPLGAGLLMFLFSWFSEEAA